MQRDIHAAGIEFAPAGLVAQLFQSEHIAIKRGHRVRLVGEQNHARHLHLHRRTPLLKLPFAA